MAAELAVRHVVYTEEQLYAARFNGGSGGSRI